MTESQTILLTSEEIETIGMLLRDSARDAFGDGVAFGSKVIWALAVKVDPGGTQDESAPWVVE